MDSILFEHNRKAYLAAVSMMEQTGRAAVIHPTGTGKSFLAFQLCADHSGQRICLLSPSEYIYRTQVEKWHAAGGAKLKNIQFITYARLMRMRTDELSGIQPDYIVLDEFHRLGATQWGGGVGRLREMYPGAKVLGLSATNIRYLDNQRDMAWELLGGNVASELTLGAAVATGILPAPKYVLSVYSYQKELRRYEMRVRQAKNKAVRDRAEKELEALRRALEKADGLPEVFERHMLGEMDVKSVGIAGAGTAGKKTAEAETTGMRADREKAVGMEAIITQISKNTEPQNTAHDGKKRRHCGKYLVFCADYDHLLEMRELAAEWFAKVDPAPHIYTAYSENPETSAEFAAFKADKSEHLKLLYCIDMLNEGIHVNGVDGVILLRPTVSPTIYKQQIGRALASGGTKTPVIFDIVMNIENLCSIGAVEEELREAVFAYRTDGRGDEIVSEHFRVIDELGDCRRLFAQLNETLGASWEAMYAMAEGYYKEHGNLEIPAKYTTPDGYSLGAWIATQRKVHAGKVAGNLSDLQVKKLSEIGMRWEDRNEANWERAYAAACAYYHEHGNLDVPSAYETKDGFRLGRWVRRQREVYRGMAQEGKPAASIGSGKEFGFGQEQEGTVQCDSGRREEINAPQGIVSDEKEYRKSYENLRANMQRGEEKRRDILGERIRRLSQIGMVWENGDPWEARFALAKEYYGEHGNLEIPADYVVEGIWLGRWLREQKSRYAAGGKETDAAQNSAKPEPLPFKFAPQTTVDGERTKTEDKIKPLTEQQKEKLRSIGFVPDMSKTELTWREQYGKAAEFYHKHGNLSIPKRYTSENGKKLGIWLQHQRTRQRGGHLAGWQVRMLEAIGMVWELDDPWESGLRHAKEYFRENGNLAVPNQYVCADGYRLGKWISNQRCAYAGIAKKRLGKEQIQQLEAVGMVWSSKRGRQGRKEKQGVEQAE